MNHKDWLDNEYKQFIQALNESTVNNFQQHPMVLRMLGTVEEQQKKFDYYAPLVLAQNPKSICEIGGGSGLFYVTLRRLGYKGDYFIADLPEVKSFQIDFASKNGFELGFTPTSEFDFCVSLYALGEFDDETKNKYVESVVKNTPHGLVVWNPHSGASSEINWECKIEDEPFFTMEGNKLLTW